MQAILALLPTQSVLSSPSPPCEGTLASIDPQGGRCFFITEVPAEHLAHLTVREELVQLRLLNSCSVCGGYGHGLVNLRVAGLRVGLYECVNLFFRHAALRLLCCALPTFREVVVRVVRAELLVCLDISASWARVDLSSLFADFNCSVAFCAFSFSCNAFAFAFATAFAAGAFFVIDRIAARAVRI